MIQLKEIVKFMNSGECRWQVITKQAKTVFRKAILLPDIQHINHSPFPVEGISKHYAFLIIGYHKIAFRHLMCACDICLECGWKNTPACSFAKFCGDWDGIDLALDAYPKHSSPNQAHRIRGFQARDGRLTRPLRITPLLSKVARQKSQSTSPRNTDVHHKNPSLSKHLHNNPSRNLTRNRRKDAVKHRHNGITRRSAKKTYREPDKLN